MTSLAKQQQQPMLNTDIFASSDSSTHGTSGSHLSPDAITSADHPNARRESSVSATSHNSASNTGIDFVPYVEVTPAREGEATRTSMSAESRGRRASSHSHAWDSPKPAARHVSASRDKEQRHREFLDKLLSHKLTPSFLH